MEAGTLIKETLPVCPVEATLALITSRWKVLVLRDLLDYGTMRFGELRRSVGKVFQKMPTKKRSRSIRAWSAMFFRAGTEGFEPPTAGTKNRSSTVELRPSMGVAKSNSSSLPNLRGHRKRHRVGVPRASGRRWQ